MNPSPPARIGRAARAVLERARRGARSALAAWLMATVGGASGAVVQGVAWIDMARQAGGLSQLSGAMLDAEPCNLCHLARRMAGNSGDDPLAPPLRERGDGLRLNLSLGERIAVPPLAERDDAAAFPPPEPIRIPGSRGERPSVPPPQLAAA